MSLKILVGAGIVGIILAALLVKFKSAKSGKGDSKEKILEECFGAKMYASTLSLTEVSAWIKARGNLLTATSKAVVLKVNDETLKSIGKEFHLGDSAYNLIIIAIVNESDNEIKASALMKYDHLDNRLNEMLERGNGVLVIEQ